MSKKLDNLKHTVAEDVGALSGVMVGVLQGGLETMLLPTYLRQRIQDDEVHPAFLFSYKAASIPDVEESLKAIERNRDLKHGLFFNTFVGRECYILYNKAIEMTRKPVASVVRWTLPLAVASDLSDDSIEHIGYAIIPFTLSALYEIGQAVYRKFHQNSTVSL